MEKQNCNNANCGGEEKQVPNLPTLLETKPNGETLKNYFRDLEVCADIKEVQIKQAPSEKIQPTKVSLPEAIELFTAETIRGMQVIYAYEGKDYVDTLISMNGHHKLIRMEMTD